MNRLEQMYARWEKQRGSRKTTSIERVALKQKAKSFRKMSKLFHVCGDLSELSAMQIEKDIK